MKRNLFSKKFFLSLKHYKQQVATILLLLALLVSGIFWYQPRQSFAATYNFIQTDWSGGATALNAIHPTNESGWNQFSVSANVDFLSTIGDIKNTTATSSVTQVTDTDFNSGVFSTTTVSSTGSMSLSSILVSKFSNGGFFSLVLKSDGTIWSSGYNGYGQLGLGDIVDRSIPVQVGTGTNWSSVSAGYFYSSSAIKSDGTLWSWGYNNYGQLGLGDLVDKSIPTQVGIGTNWSSVSVGYASSLAVKSDGTLWSWGYNNYGQLGLGDTISRPTPTQVGTGTNWSAVSTGFSSSLAVKSDGTLWSWGYNNYGQLGLGDVTSRSAPVQVGTGINWSAVSTGFSSSLAVKSDGTLWSWGYNNYGQLGLGDVTSRSAPVQVGTGINWSSVSAGYSSSLATKSDKTLWSWGYNAYGQLGLGDLVDKSTPTQVGTGINWSSVSAGYYFSSSVKSDGTIWFWGYNNHGQFGVGDTASKSIPTQTTALIGGNYPSGIFISSALDIPNVSLNTLNWIATTTSSTALEFQIASSPDNISWTNFSGPDGTTSTYYTISGTQIWSGHNGNEYIKYKAYLSTTDISQTPEFGDINIIYNLYTTSSSLTSSPYNASDATNLLAGVGWVESLPSITTAVKFQLRTASDAIGSPGIWTSWMGPDGTSSTYFTDTSSACSTSVVTDGTEVQCSVPTTIAIGSGSDSQWIQYRAYLTTDGSQAPILKEAKLIYVVNAPPEFNPDYPTVGAGGVSAIQNSDGSVSINYSARDPDTDTGSITPGYVTPSFEYSLNGGTSWSSISGSCLITGDLGNKSVATSTWSSYIVNWNPECESGVSKVTYSTTTKIKAIIDDNELANHSVPQDSTNFVLLTKPLKTDASKSPATIFLPSLVGATQMKIGLTSDLSNATWQTYIATTSISLSTDPDTVYAQFTDNASATSSIISVSTLETPTSLMVQDTSNIKLKPSEYRLFVAWKVVGNPSTGFKQYNIFRSTDQTNWTQIKSITDRLLNYYGDITVASTSEYYYKISVEDNDGSISYFSPSIGPGLANGVQDSGEGGGGVSTIPPIISNINVNSNNTGSVDITWTTDKLSNSNVYYRATSTWPGINTTAYSSSQGIPSMVTSHSVTVSELQPNSQYYFLVKSVDPSGNFTNKSDSTSTFVTNSGPSISGVSVIEVTNNTTTIIWNTDVSSDSYVVYSLNSDMSNSQIHGSSDLTTSHSVVVSRLIQGKKYYFYVKSADSASNTAYDKNVVNGIVQYYTFTTIEDFTPPVISNISLQVSTSTTMVIWKTNKLADSKVDYGLTTSYGNVATSSTLTIDHIINLSNLNSNTVYHYNMVSTDANNNIVTSTDYTFTTHSLIDTTSPIISSVATSSVNLTGATITWVTNESSNSLVDYGETTSLGYLAGGANDSVTSHSVSLIDLTASTTYYFQVKSQDSLGNTATDNNSSTYYSFITAKDVTPPIISNISTSTVSDTKSTIVWTTNELSTSKIVYGETSSYGSQTAEDVNLTYQHSGTIVGLIKQKTYHYKVVSVDASGNSVSSGDNTFTTTDKPGIVKTVTKIVSGGLVVVRQRANLDITTPFIFNLKVKKVTNTSADIIWNTSEPTDTSVEYGITNIYNKGAFSIEGLTFTSSHSITLNSLIPGTTYHFRALGKDKSGNLGKSIDTTFLTLAKNSVIATVPIDKQVIPENEKATVNKITSFLIKLTNPYSLLSIEEILQATAARVVNPPIITGNKVNVEAGVDSVNIKWVTNNKSNSLVSYTKNSEYDLNKTKPYSMTSGNPEESVINHIVKLTGLSDSTAYHFQVISKANIGGTAKTKDSVFKTLSKSLKAENFGINSLTQKSIKISWQTGVPTKSEIKLVNQKTGETIIKKDGTYISRHISLVGGLIPGDSYAIQILSTDEKNNKAASSVHTITTLLSNNPPVISNILIKNFIIPGNNERVQTVIRWKTDKPATSKVYYQEGISRNSQSLKNATKLDKNLVKNHVLITTVLYSGKIYQLKIESIDSSGRSSDSSNYAIITPKSKENIIDIMSKTFGQVFGFLGKVKM